MRKLLLVLPPLQVVPQPAAGLVRKFAVRKTLKTKTMTYVSIKESKGFESFDLSLSINRNNNHIQSVTTNERIKKKWKKKKESLKVKEMKRFALVSEF